MSEKARLILGIIMGIVCAIAIFCLVVVICCAVNGVTFGQQICNWFGENTAPANIADIIEQTPII